MNIKLILIMAFMVIVESTHFEIKPKETRCFIRSTSKGNVLSVNVKHSDQSR